jgi:hypothetical protein
LLLVVNIVVPAPTVPVVVADFDDDHVLACVAVAGADLVVSGDSGFLDVKAYQGIPIVTAAEVLKQLPRRRYWERPRASAGVMAWMEGRRPDGGGGVKEAPGSDYRLRTRVR